MKPIAVTPLFSRLGELFVEGRLREMTGHWAYPCPVEVEGDLQVMRRPEDLEAFFAIRLSDARTRGVRAWVPRIAAIEMPRKGRFRVWLRWVEHMSDGVVEDEQVSVYYLVQRPWGGLLIEMMDVVPHSVLAQPAYA